MRQKHIVLFIILETKVLQELFDDKCKSLVYMKGDTSYQLIVPEVLRSVPFTKGSPS